MASPALSSTSTTEYPSSDGQPMAESDFQRKPLTYGVVNSRRATDTLHDGV